MDAISSLGSEELSVVKDKIDWCVGSSNKCIEGLPGLSFVCSKHEMFKNLEFRKRQGFYLDLWEHYNSQFNLEAPLFTPAVQTLFSFEIALDNLITETVKERNKRYLKKARLLRHALKKNGFRFLISDENMMSCGLTVVFMPDGVSYQALHDLIKQEGFMIWDSRFQWISRVNIRSIVFLGKF